MNDSAAMLQKTNTARTVGNAFTPERVQNMVPSDSLDSYRTAQLHNHARTLPADYYNGELAKRQLAAMGGGNSSNYSAETLRRTLYPPKETLVSRSRDASIDRPMPFMSRFDARRATAELDKIIDDLLNFSSSSGLHALKARVNAGNYDAYLSSNRNSRYRYRVPTDTRTSSSTPLTRITSTTQREPDAAAPNPQLTRTLLGQTQTASTAPRSSADGGFERDNTDYYQRRWLMHNSSTASPSPQRYAVRSEVLSGKLNDERLPMINGSAPHARQIDMLRMQDNHDAAQSTSSSSTFQNSMPNKIAISTQYSISTLANSQNERNAQSVSDNVAEKDIKAANNTVESKLADCRGKQHQAVRVECFEEVESIGLQPIGKGVHDLPVNSGRVLATTTANSNLTLPSIPSTRPAGFVERDVEVVTLHPIGRGVRDLGRPLASRLILPGVAQSNPANRAISSAPAAVTAYQSQARQVPKGAHPAEAMRSHVHVAAMKNDHRADNTYHTSRPFGSFLPNTLPMSANVIQRRLGSVQPVQCSPARTSSFASSLALATAPDEVQRRILMVQDRSRWWFKPNMPREDLVKALLTMRVGSFLVRKSSTYPGAYGLAIRVDAAPSVVSRSTDLEKDLIRHFLIEPTSQGMRLRGYSNEPVFTSLSALIYQHSVTALGLPCCLILPDFDPAPQYSELYQSTQSLLSVMKGQPDSNLARVQVAGILNSIESLSAQSNDGPSLTTTLTYVGGIDVESLSGPQAVSRAFQELYNSFRRGLATSLTEIKLTISAQGVTISDVNRRLFFRKHLPLPSILYCGIDPEDRRLTDLTRKGGNSAKLLGIVARKQAGPLSGAALFENTCHMFAEMSQSIPIAGVVSFLCQFVHSATAH